jgi:hypothetical protein
MGLEHVGEAEFEGGGFGGGEAGEAVEELVDEVLVGLAGGGEGVFAGTSCVPLSFAHSFKWRRRGRRRYPGSMTLEKSG